jgi:phytoene dehydrogenase-like protein
MHDADVVVVGGGLTGLRAALEISRGGLSVLLVERGNSVGGRVRTSDVDGFKLDHGFQVLLSGYPELTLISGIDSLQSKPFTSGARIRWKGRFYDLLDPRAKLSALLTAFTLPFASPRDLAQMARLATFYRDDEVRSDGETTAQLLERYRFSPSFREAFLQPFLGGVLLDRNLSADAAMTRFYLKVFAEGPAVLPHNGMQAFPQLLATHVGSSHILLGASAAEISAREVILESGETLRARRVVCALDFLGAARLGCPEQTMPSHSVGVFYYSSCTAPFSEPVLVLNGDGVGPINNLAVLTNVQPSYAPAGRSLISVTVLGALERPSEEALKERIECQLREWYGSHVESWEFIRSFLIDSAVPARPRLGCGWIEHEGVFFAGDYLSYGSQNGALRAGRRVAQAVLEDF